MIVFFGDV